MEEEGAEGEGGEKAGEAEMGEEEEESGGWGGTEEDKGEEGAAEDKNPAEGDGRREVVEPTGVVEATGTGSGSSTTVVSVAAAAGIGRDPTWPVAAAACTAAALGTNPWPSLSGFGAFFCFSYY